MSNETTDTDDSGTAPNPYSTHEGKIANELREIYNILTGFGDPEARNKRAKAKIATLTQDLEQTAWGETRPMDHVPTVSADPDEFIDSSDTE